MFAVFSLGTLGCTGHLGDGDAPGEPLGTLEHAVLFNTPEADTILARLKVFPSDNPWNQEILNRPVRPDSSALIASIGANVALAWNLDMNFVLVPSSQRPVAVAVNGYAHESDPGPFPIPGNAPIEGWPLHESNGGGSIPSDLLSSLATIQREGEGDRHLIVVDPARRRLVELLGARLGDLGWQASQSSVFDLSSNALRPEDWTSADAAGLPIFPAIVRYDEVASGVVRHAMRFTAPTTRNAYVHPARHFAGSSNSPLLPRMGERLRLRGDFDTTRFSPHACAVLEGLKTYGMMLADNGRPWAIS
ncbi:MAG: hypothetical protein ACMG6S_32420, partial [Byssovorax sp.]